MEPHPIQQNVTSFQFHLVGDMTLKQFLYLASGCGSAYIIFVTVAVKYPLVAWPLIIILTLSGIAFAFLPFASRPLDYWVVAFFKAIYSPTKRIWKKSNKTYKEVPLFATRFTTFLARLQGRIAPVATTTASSAPQTAQPVAQPANAPIPNSKLPSKDDLAKTVNLAKEAQDLKFKIIDTERTLGHIKTASAQPAPIPVDYSKQINQAMADLQTLVGQASTIQTQLDHVTNPEQFRLTPVPPAILKETVKVVIPSRPKQTQVALTTFPNVINGIIKDKAGNYLEGVVAVIYDKEGLPVRALKTNKLGQFTGSTPLPNATYTLETEKEGLTFDVLQIELAGEVLPPLLITPK